MPTGRSARIELTSEKLSASVSAAFRPMITSAWRRFWLGAVAHMSGHAHNAVVRSLHALEAKEFVRRERRSTVDGEIELSFRHTLVRDIAYGRIPRARRAEKHRLAAEWIELLGHPEAHAETCAHHYGRALDRIFARVRNRT